MCNEENYLFERVINFLKFSLTRYTLIPLWKVEGNKLACDAPLLGVFIICYSYEDDRFEVFYNGELIGYKNTMSAAKLVANDFYKSHICNILGLFPNKNKREE